MNDRYVAPLIVLLLGAALIVTGSLPGVSVACAVCGAFLAAFGAFLVLVA